MQIVRQGKYECAAACLAQVTGVKLFHVKRAMGRAGWRNDDSGADHHMMRAAARACGFDLVCVGRWALYTFPDLPPSILTVPSLNYSWASHAVSLVDDTVIDPNYGDPKRKYWDPETPVTEMEVQSVQILLPRPMAPIEEERYQQCQYREEKAQFLREFLGVSPQTQCHQVPSPQATQSMVT